MPIEVTEEFLSGVVDHVEAVQTLVEKQAAQEAEVTTRGPIAVDMLIKAGMLKESERASALEVVNDPVKVMDALIKTAEVLAAEKSGAAPQTMGGGVDTTDKTAGTSKSHTKKASASENTLEEANRKFIKSFGL